MTPTSRTLKLLRTENKLAEITERWNSFSRNRVDLFSFIDIIALDVDAKVTWGVQCSTTGNMNARINKIITECRDKAVAWLAVGNKIEVIGWAKRGKKAKRKTWVVKRIEITIDDFDK